MSHAQTDSESDTTKTQEADHQEDSQPAHFSFQVLYKVRVGVESDTFKKVIILIDKVERGKKEKQCAASHEGGHVPEVFVLETLVQNKGLGSFLCRHSLWLDHSSSVKHRSLIGWLFFPASPIILKIERQAVFSRENIMRLAQLSLFAGSKKPSGLGLKSLRMLFTGTMVLMCGCASSSQADNDKGTLVEDKYSLRADREALESLRKDIPAEVRKENDEKAFMDGMMSDLSRNPSEVRSRFSSVLNKKRDLFNKDMNKARETFNQEQRKEREAFTAEQGELRKSFSGKKVDAAERRAFFDDLDLKRKNFYANQKEKRDEFEAGSRDKRKDFDDYVKSKNDEFNQLHRDYTKRFEEAKRAKLEMQKQAEGQRKQQDKNLEEQYEPIRKLPPTILEPGSGE